MLVNTHQCLYDEGDKAQIAEVVLTRSVEQYAGICSERPVIVLSGTIDAIERFFVEQAAEAVLAGYLLHQ